MSATTRLNADEAAEASAFNQRIEERIAAGFIPDLRRAVKCEYFYKSFWRDPHFIDLYLGEQAKTYIELLSQYGGSGLRILDVGCGAGYFSLELARAGHHVLAIDISESCIATARQTLESNPFKEGFGSLEYQAMPLRDATGVYDAILFSGVIHHFDHPEEVTAKAAELLKSEGLFICAEPRHESWRLEDAAQVALIRALLSLTGFWYETSLGDDVLESDDRLASYVEEVHVEYVTEQDKHEQGQSPHDNDCSGQEILDAVMKHFRQLEIRPGVAFIYRMLGGLRGPEETIYKLADLLASYDRLGVTKGFIRPGGFIFVGRKTS